MVARAALVFWLATASLTAQTVAHYVGSASCQPCHAQIYARWQKTPMANIVRDPKVHPEAIVADFAHPTPAVTFTPTEVALVYGSIWKQRYFARQGNDYYILPAQWDIGNKKWLPFFVKDDWWAPLFPPDNKQRPTSQLCDGCHSVNFDIATHTVTEWNVGCERCHGPGSAHVAQPAVKLADASQKTSLGRGSDVCIQCHSQGRPLQATIGGKVYDWPVGYTPGGDLDAFWKLEDHRLGETTFTHFADGTAHKNRMQGNDFVQSVMYTRGVTCASCHDVHGTANPAQLRAPASELCLQCHAPGSPNGPHTATTEAHTHHAAGSAGNECINCHMPKIATQGVPGAMVRSHTFKFMTPAMTDAYKIPNPCTGCHTERTTEWATATVKKWYSPWRMQ